MINAELRELYNQIDVLNGNIHSISREDNVMVKDEMSKAQVARINDLLTLSNKLWAEFVEKHESEFTDD